jgi:hypothetical protein
MEGKILGVNAGFFDKRFLNELEGEGFVPKVRGKR